MEDSSPFLVSSHDDIRVGNRRQCWEFVLLVLDVHNGKEESACLDNKHTDNPVLMISIKFAAIFC